MNKTPTEAKVFLERLAERLPGNISVEVALAPPFPALQTVGQAIADTSWKLAAQNLFWEEEGAYTGEVSGAMLKDLRCHYVIVGHSERRKLFGEEDSSVNKKVKAALQHGLYPILCVGESLKERDTGQTQYVVQGQVLAGLSNLDKGEVNRVTLAYEPVWAIGTGRAASVAQAAEVHALLRDILTKRWGIDPQSIRIVYGGGVSPDNAGELFQSSQINGALVGKACLDPDSFARIVKSADQ